ncbi:hypothetical protein CYLTODRAFT_459644 [Cylindrobasidium torrendii FP15055 ss-10]|uniref:RING-type domain-containing protein n=1 Tax=Cylindrobasidium torrendii FP15055 ss-10 TaxID=1314674 RepID=A0A0D7AV44_9AGAR|nr:hypothetical protein CYLTODRAFT_459644 [Cylindrobasidium torrendii FP15055 ss-10]
MSSASVPNSSLPIVSATPALVAAANPSSFELDPSISATATAVVDFPQCSFEFHAGPGDHRQPSFQVSVKSEEFCFKIHDAAYARALKEKEEREMQLDLLRQLICGVCGKISAAPVIALGDCDHVMCARCVIAAVYPASKSTISRCPARGCDDYLWNGFRPVHALKAACEANGGRVEAYPDFNFRDCKYNREAATPAISAAASPAL